MRFHFLERKIASLKETGFKNSLKWIYGGQSLKKKKCFSHFHLEKNLHFQVKCRKHVQVYQYYWLHRKSMARPGFMPIHMI